MERDFSENNDGKAKNNKALVLGAIGALLILAVVFVIFNAVVNIAGKEHLHSDYDEVVEEISKIETAVLIQDLSFLNETMGSEAQTAARNIISEVLEDKEKSTDGTITASVSGRNVVNSIYFPYNVCTFVLDVSNGSYYDVNVASQGGGKYFGMTLQKMVPTAEKEAKFYIVFMEGAENDNYDREAVIASLTKWAKSKNSGELVLTTRDLF